MTHSLSELMHTGKAARIFSTLIKILPYLWIFGSLTLPDIWLRITTRWIGAYSIFEIAPNLFTVLWAVLLTILITFPTSTGIRKLLYGITYFLFLIYALIQCAAWLTLDKFLYISDFLNAGEGANYASWVTGFISISLVVQMIGLILVGIVSLALISRETVHRVPSGVYLRLVIAAACVIGILMTPKLYGAPSGAWDDFNHPAFEYDKFVNPNYDLELTGMYQFLAKDLANQVSRISNSASRDTTAIDEYFSDKAVHTDNAMTGIFEGKNVIIVMMESMDDWLITPEDTPTLFRLMEEGIQFSNFYTPDYASGYTFNTEFAFNTSVYPYSNGNVTYALVDHTFSASAASMFAEAGYSVNSYHEGTASFYNRGSMHHTFGYSEYHSYREYPQTDVSVTNDRFLFECEDLYQDLTENTPFCSFVITYSAHLPYTDTDELVQYALKCYPQYNVEENRELHILKAKARLTDDMFAGILSRLENDDLLNDTVIIGFADHYSFGLSDSALLQMLSEEAGCSILERTPAFIYCSDWDTPLNVDKVMQITDLAPTLMNLFGLDVPKEIMGQDIFDENYTGYAIFPGNTWLTSTTYVKNGVVIWNNGMSESEIADMNAQVQQIYKINDAILDTDYYAQKKESK